MKVHRMQSYGVSLAMRACGITQCYTFHPTQVKTPRVNPSLKPVLVFAIPKGWKAEFT